MKPVSAYFFVFLYVLAMVRPVMPVLEYIVEHDYIAEYLCINKDRPELQCNGKCYLMRKLAEQNEQKKLNLPPISMEDYPIGFVRLLAVPVPKNIDSHHSTSTLYREDYRYLYSYSDFHPPSIIF